MRTILTIGTLLLIVACGVKAPPRPPVPEAKPAANSETPAGTPERPKSACDQTVGGCIR